MNLVDSSVCSRVRHVVNVYADQLSCRRYNGRHDSSAHRRRRRRDETPPNTAAEAIHSYTGVRA